MLSLLFSFHFLWLSFLFLCFRFVRFHWSLPFWRLQSPFAVHFRSLFESKQMLWNTSVLRILIRKYLEMCMHNLIIKKKRQKEWKNSEHTTNGNGRVHIVRFSNAFLRPPHTHTMRQYKSFSTDIGRHNKTAKEKNDPEICKFFHVFRVYVSRSLIYFSFSILPFYFCYSLCRRLQTKKKIPPKTYCCITETFNIISRIILEVDVLGKFEWRKTTSEQRKLTNGHIRLLCSTRNSSE